MTIFVVRHAKAGHRESWDGDDRLRPLSSSGRKQAEALADRLASHAPVALMSSPFVRCRETLQPLAHLVGIDVVDEPRLAEGASIEESVALVAGVEDGSVLCSHGDVIPDLVQALVRRGARLAGEANWRKASVWLLERSAAGDVTDLSVWPPPEL
jgi:phosphohistidine phosphatase SixA